MSPQMLQQTSPVQTLISKLNVTTYVATNISSPDTDLKLDVATDVAATAGSPDAQHGLVISVLNLVLGDAARAPCLPHVANQRARGRLHLHFLHNTCQ